MKMKKPLIVVASVLVLVIAGLVALPLLIPADKIKTQVTEQVKTATGRDLSVEGKVSVSVFPSLSVEVANVGLANPGGFRAKELLRLGALTVKLKLLPLLSGRLEVDSFVLVDPVISLEVDSEGRADWAFGPPAVDRPAADANANAKTGGAQLSDLHLGDVRIVNGKLLYVDDKAGNSETVDAIDLRVSLTSLDQPLSAKGGFTWRGQVMTLGLDLGKPRVLFEGRGTAPVAVTISSEPVKLSLSGDVDGAGKAVTGTVDLSVPSVRGLAAWAGKPLDMPGGGLGPLSLKGKLAAGDRHVAVTQAVLTLDSLKAAGDVSIDTGGAKPQVKAALDIETLDLNPYLPSEAPGGGRANDDKPAIAAKSTANGKQDWSDDPIDASALQAVEADLNLNVGAIKLHKIQLGKTRLVIALHDGKLAADLGELALYNGGGKGHVTIDGTPPGVALDGVFALKGIQAEPFLADAMGFDRIEGTGNFDLQIVGHGASQRQIVSSLGGKGSVGFLNGAIKGIDLASMLKNVSTAFTNTGGAQKTDFAKLSGTFTMAAGTVSNQDMVLKTPVLQVGGAGTIDLPKRSVDYRLTPKLAAGAAGQGGKLDIGDLTVPVVVEGPWDNPTYRPDLKGMLKSGAEKAARDALGKALGQPGKGGSLPFDPRGLFGR